MDLEPKNLRETQPLELLTPEEREIIGMYKAIRFVRAKAANQLNVGFTGGDINELNKAIRNDSLNPHKMGLRKSPLLRVMCYVRGERRDAAFEFIEPEELKERFDNFSTTFKEKTQEINRETAVAEVLDLAAWTHINLIRIHPFLDGNGRTARLLVDLVFEKNNLPIITDWGVKKDEYKDIVDRTYREKNYGLFKKFLARKLLKSIKALEREGLVEELADKKKQVMEYMANIK